MQISAILLGLAATTVSAIDIRHHYSYNCAGINGVCYNAATDWCCGVGSGDPFGSIGFGPIPSGWTIDMRAHASPGCGAVRQNAHATGPVNNWCLNSNGPYSGGGYSSVGKKRSEGGEVECHKFDAISLNGTDLSITHLSADEQTELFQIAKDAADLSTIEGQIAGIVKARK